MKPFLIQGYRLAHRAWAAVISAATSASRFLRPLAIVCSIGFALGTVARQVDIPSDTAWKRAHPLPVIWLAAGLVTASRYVILDRDRMRRKRQSATDGACQTVASHISRRCPAIPLRLLGIQIWAVRGPPFDRYLHRVSRFMIDPRRPTSVAWTGGKGVFGVAWREQAPAIMDLDAQLYQLAPNEAAFAALPPDLTLGLSWREVQRTNRYKAVYSAPLFDRHPTNPRVIGLLSIDVMETGHFDDLFRATFEDHDFNTDILGLCEAALLD